MKKTVLFSPVGGTDPMSEWNGHDGALLHIARHYKPDVIYLYMSKEIMENHLKDDRYRYCLNELGKLLGHPFDIRMIERPELEKVQLFDPIFEDFEKELDQITAEMEEEDELLLNISSGTPSMKSSLLVLATMLDIPCQCIQVDTPVGKMNNHEHSKEYFPDERWKQNPDNTYVPGDKNYNRTHSEQLISLKRLKYEETIKKFVRSYDYHAALVLAQEMKQHTASYINKLKLADARQQLDFGKVNNLLKGQDAAVYRPVKQAETRMVYEYMLALQAKVDKAEYADFVRGLSPIFSDIFDGILRRQAGFDLTDFTKIKHGMRVWDMSVILKHENNGIKKIFDNAYGKKGGFKGDWVKSDHLVVLIKGLVSSPSVLKCVKDLRKVEESVRNMASHNMVSVTDNWICQKTGQTSREIVEKIREAFTYTSYDIDPVLWDSYKKMNEDIFSAI